MFHVDVFFFKQKAAYEMPKRDWSSDVCSSDLAGATSLACRSALLFSFSTWLYRFQQTEPTARRARAVRRTGSLNISFSNSGCVSKRLIAAGASHKVFLAIEGFRAGQQRGIASIGLEFASFCIVGEISIEQDITQEALRVAIGNRSDHFDAVVKISGHQISTADVDLIMSAIGKPEHTAVLEETAHDAAHADVFGKSRNARAQHADATYDQIDLHAGT